MKHTKIAARYGKALFDLALEKNQLDEVYNDMILVDQVASTSKELNLVLKNPVIRTDKKKAVLTALFLNKVSVMVANFLTLLITKNRSADIAIISEEFISLYKVHKNIKTVVLSSAKALDVSLKNSIVSMVKDAYKCDVDLKEVLKPELIGGYVLKIDDNLYDASILSKINALNREFNVNIYVRGY
ncbi:MAG: ATP synthase F1 subunit delta [Bacteroidota bacterium]